MRLTPNFTLTELRGADAPQAVQVRLRQLAELAEQFRLALGGRPMVVTSGYRSPAHNAAVGGVDGSQHTKGEALDFHVPGLTLWQVAAILNDQRNTLPNFGQLIYYPASGHIHLSLPRGSGKDRQVLVKASDGRFPALSSELLAKLPGAPGVRGTALVLVVLGLSMALRALELRGAS